MKNTGTSLFDRLFSLASGLPEVKKAVFLQKVEATLALGVRAIVLANLERKDREEFERISLSGGDAKILEFGFKKISHFEQLINSLAEKVYMASRQITV